MKVKLSRIQLLYIGFGDHYIGNDGKLYFKDGRDIASALTLKKVLQQADSEKLFPETGMAIVKSTDNFSFKNAVTETPSVIFIDYLNDTTVVALSVYPKSRITEADLMAGLRYFSQLKREGTKYFKADGTLYADLTPLSKGHDKRTQEGNSTGNPDEGARHGLGIVNWGNKLLDQIADALLDALGLDPVTYRKWVYGILAAYLGTKTFDANQTPTAKKVYGTGTAVLALKFLNSQPPEGSSNSNSPPGAGTSFIGRMELSKGLRNNNPLNIHVSARLYKGKVAKPLNPDFDTDGKQLERFETFEYGLKAGSEHLLRYFNGNIDPLNCYQKSEGKLNTIHKILNRWVCGLNPAAYVAYVERETGFNRNTVLDLNDKQVLTRLIYAMTLNECGVKYKDSLLNATDFQKYMKGALAIG